MASPRDVLDACPLVLPGSPLGATRKGAVAGEGALLTVGSQRPSEHQPESKVPERQQAEARLLPSRQGAGQPQASPSHMPVGPHGGPVTGVSRTQGPCHVWTRARGMGVQWRKTRVDQGSNLSWREPWDRAQAQHHSHGPQRSAACWGDLREHSSPLGHAPRGGAEPPLSVHVHALQPWALTLGWTLPA